MLILPIKSKWFNMILSGPGINRRNTERLNRIIQRGLRKYLKCTQTQIFLQDLINS